MGLMDTVRNRLLPVKVDGPAAFTQQSANSNGKPIVGRRGQIKAATGVSFVGSPDWKTVVVLGTSQDFDAEELTRSIAMATSAYAYTAIMYRATRLAEPPLMVVQENDDGEVAFVPGHELEMMLDEPSPDYDMGELQLLTEVYRLVTGSCLWVKLEDTAGRQARWVPFSGEEFTSKSANGLIYGQFLVDTRQGRRIYLPEEVVHLRDPNPNSWRTGLSRLDVALMMLDLGHQVNRTVRNYMRKAMFPGGVISPDKDWNPDDDEWDAWLNSIAAWHAGPANAGEPLVVQGGTTFSKAAVGLKDLLPGEMLDRIEAIVSSVFGIPPVVLGWLVGLKNSPWSQMEQARQYAYEDTIEPRWKDVQKKMTRQLLTREEREQGMRIEFNLDKIRAFIADDATRAGVAKQNADIWTRDERRQYTGKDPLPEGDPRGDEFSSGGGATDVTTLGEGETSITTGLSVLLRQGTKAVADRKVLEWCLFDMQCKAAERTWESTIAAELKRQQAEVLRLADEWLEEKALDPDSIVQFIAAVGEFFRKDEGLRTAVYPLVVSTGTQGVKRAAAQTGLSFGVLEPGLLDYAAEEADFLASVMKNTSGRQVAAVVQTQLAEGGLIADIRKALETLPGFTRTRAQRAARTETTRAWNGAQRRSLSTWEASQPETTLVYKEWVSSQDDRVRPEHEDLDGTRIRIDEVFDGNLSEPSEPNCRCTLVYDIEYGG